MNLILKEILNGRLMVHHILLETKGVMFLIIMIMINGIQIFIKMNVYRDHYVQGLYMNPMPPIPKFIMLVKKVLLMTTQTNI